MGLVFIATAKPQLGMPESRIRMPGFKALLSFQFNFLLMHTLGGRM